MWVALTAAITFPLGVLTGWVAFGQFTADWVEAIGTWAGAIATIATIVWAVRTFRHETEARGEDLDRLSTEKARRELNMAEAVTVECAGGQFTGPDEARVVRTIKATVRNAASESATITEFLVSEVNLPYVESSFILPKVLDPNGGEVTAEIEVDPHIRTTRQEFKARPFTLVTPTIRYRVDGVEWERTGSDSPRRLDMTSTEPA